jgi:RHS repeat-associated protein
MILTKYKIVYFLLIAIVINSIGALGQCPQNVTIEGPSEIYARIPTRFTIPFNEGCAPYGSRGIFWMIDGVPAGGNWTSEYCDLSIASGPETVNFEYFAYGWFGEYYGQRTLTARYTSTPEILEPTNVQSSSFKVHLAEQPNVESYWIYVLDDQGNFMYEDVMYESSTTISGLKSFEKYTIYVQAFGPDGPSILAQRSFTYCYTPPDPNVNINVSNDDNPCSAKANLSYNGMPPEGINWYWQIAADGTQTNASENKYIANGSGAYYLRARASKTCPDYWSPGKKVAHVVVNECVNWLGATIYSINADGSPKEISSSKTYLDGAGSPIQTQVKSFVNNEVFATQIVRDAEGKDVLTTLAAPVQSHSFAYKDKFITNASGQKYSAVDFDIETETLNNPVPVGKNVLGTLGWYYSSNNTLEPQTPTTDYPYTRVWAEASPDPREARVAWPGNDYRMGANHEGKGERFAFSAEELSHYYAIRSHFIATPILVKSGYKYVTTHPNNKKSVSFLDVNGLTLATAIVISPNDNSSPQSFVYDYWSYTFYNDIGQVIATVSPEGVKIGDNSYPNFVTKYTYDHVGRVIGKNTPDEGTTEFTYSVDGKIRFSQDEVQRNANPKRFSYSNYDFLGRLIETGEYTSILNGYAFQTHNNVYPLSNSILNIVENSGFTDITKKQDPNNQISEYNFIEYDLSLTDFPSDQYHTSQKNLLGEISCTENINTKTWYSYDDLGNLSWSKQFIKDLGVYKTVDYIYNYDGSLIDMIFQKGQPDCFYHHYIYNDDLQLTEVWTSKDGHNKTIQAKYQYYLHGPLKRVELGGNIQGIDYAYNIDGTLKLINNSDPELDPGRDGFEGLHSNFMKDAFGEVLDYNSNDYTGAGYNEGNLQVSGVEQYTGMLKAVRWHSHVDNHVQRAYTFTYDNVDQFKDAVWGNVKKSGSDYSIETVINDPYKENVNSYDKNGNIKELQRNGKFGTTIANYKYWYKNNTNQLYQIQHNNNSLITYDYNQIGQMVSQAEASKTMKVTYTLTGLVKEIRDGSDRLILSFDYDDLGNRLKKTLYFESGAIEATTYYIYDAFGSLLSVYETNRHTSALEQTEIPIHGAQRIGVYKPLLSTFFYEVTDHLGNVRTVIGSPEEVTLIATLEDNGMADVENPRIQEMRLFKNLSSTAVADSRMNHSEPTLSMPVPKYSSYLKWVNGIEGQEAEQKSVGPATGLRVEPGDKINIEVFAKYKRKSSYSRQGITSAMTNILASSFVGTARGIDVMTQARGVFQNGVAFAISSTSSEAPIVPYAFVYYLLYDRNFNPITQGWSRVSSAGGFDAGKEAFSLHEKLSIPDIHITEPGYIFIFVSNESENTEVWFDDLKVNHQRSAVVSGADFYPFGLTMDTREITREDYRYGYQGQFSEEDKETGWNKFELRMYDARIGRWLSVDPYSQFASPYLAMGNNPIIFCDPDGGWTGGIADGLIKESARIASGNIDLMIRVTAIGGARMLQSITLNVGASFLSGLGRGFVSGITSTVQFGKSLFTSDFWLNQTKTAIMGSIDPVGTYVTPVVNSASEFAKNAPEMDKEDWGETVGFVAEKLAEAAVIRRVGTGGGTSVYRVQRTGQFLQLDKAGKVVYNSMNGKSKTVYMFIGDKAGALRYAAAKPGSSITTFKINTQYAKTILKIKHPQKAGLKSISASDIHVKDGYFRIGVHSNKIKGFLKWQIPGTGKILK